MHGGCCTKVGPLEDLQSCAAGLVGRRPVRPPRGDRGVLATLLTSGEIDPLDFVIAHRVYEWFVQQPPCNAAARADCSSSSNSAASGCAKRCARTAPLPRSRRLSSRMPGSAREQERCLGRGSAYGIGGPAVSPRATSAAITPRRVAHGRRDRPDPVAVLAVPARVAPRPRGRRLLLEHARVGDRARRRRRRWRAARRTRYVGSEGPAHRVRDLPRVGRN
jgi:hypothetical protein